MTTLGKLIGEVEVWDRVLTPNEIHQLYERGPKMAMTMERALEEHRALITKLNSLEQDIRAALEREAILKGRIEQLDHELAFTKERCDHYLRWNSEMTMQMHNINMFVQDAMHQARLNVKGNGQPLDVAQKTIEKAMEVGNEPIQHEGKR
jgi:hypothetical protein